MKKITLLFITVFTFTFGNAQTDCATAIPVTAGSTPVPVLTGTDVPDPICAENGTGATVAEWYSFTATVDGVANITSNLPGNAGGDTRLHVYTGACGALTCVVGNDDVDGANMNYLSDATFVVTSGTTYTIAWDDRWDDGGFDFILTETAVDCSTDSPYSYDFSSINPLLACYTIEDGNADGTTWGYNNGNDFNGDTVNDGVALIFPQASATPKDDWLFLPVFNGVANVDYTITVTYNAFNNPAPAADESFEIVALNEASSTAVTQSVLATYTGITQSGELATLIQNAYVSTVTYTPTTDGDFYLAIHATTSPLNSGIITLFELSVDSTLSVDDFTSNNFTHTYNKNTDKLTLESSITPLSNIELFNILGQRVSNKSLTQNTEVIDMSSLKDGVYLAKVSIQGQTQTLKILKQ